MKPCIGIYMLGMLGLAGGPAPTGLAQEAFPRFVDIASESGVTLMNVTGDGTGDYITGANGNGAGFFDYDKDGDIDLLIANGSTLESFRNGGTPVLALYENRGDGFVDVTQAAGLSKNGWGMGVCVADYDNDGYSDFYLTAYGPNVLYRNRGNGTFEEVKVSGLDDSRWSTNCAFGDFDRDGWVDLYVANFGTFDEARIRPRQCELRGVPIMCGPKDIDPEPDALYRNNGDHTFSDVSAEAGILGSTHYGFGVLFTDLDDDGWLDLYVANDDRPNLLFRNNADGTFTEIGLRSGTSVNAIGGVEGGMGLASGDYDNDGDFDLFVTNFVGQSNTLYENFGDMFFSDVTQDAGLGVTSVPYVGWGTEFTDLDNDGWRDIFVANGGVDARGDSHGHLTGWTYTQPKEVYRNLGSGQFQEVTLEVGGDMLTPRSTRGVAFGDYDNDGDIDFVSINMNDIPNFYRNDGGNRNHWISLQLEGTDTNRDAIGARVEIDAAGMTQVGEVRSGASYLSHNDLRVHFGLGKATRVDAIRIRWPDGVSEAFDPVPANHFVTIRQGDGVVSASP